MSAVVTAALPPPEIAVPAAPSATSLHLSSSLYATAAARIASFREVQAPIFDVDIAPELHETFEWEFELRHLGTSLCGRIRAGDQFVRRTAQIIAKDSNQSVLVNLLGAGSMTGRCGQRDVDARAGDCLIYDMAQQVDMAVSGLGHAWATTFVMVPRKLLEARMDVDTLHGHVLRQDTALGQIVGGYLQTLATHASRLDPEETQPAGDATAALLAHLLVPASRMQSGPVDLGHMTLAKVRRHIDAQVRRRDLSPAVIAQECGISRSALYRLFEPLGGVVNYVRQKRLLAAHKELVAPDHRNTTIAHIARQNGFGDSASFRRAFFQMFGLSPSDARALGGNLPRGDGGEPLSTMRAWVREI